VHVSIGQPANARWPASHGTRTRTPTDAQLVTSTPVRTDAPTQNGLEPRKSLPDRGRLYIRVDTGQGFQTLAFIGDTAFAQLHKHQPLTRQGYRRKAKPWPAPLPRRGASPPRPASSPCFSSAAWQPPPPEAGADLAGRMLFEGRELLDGGLRLAGRLLLGLGL
jgi:hypothetical protein